MGGHRARQGALATARGRWAPSGAAAAAAGKGLALARRAGAQARTVGGWGGVLPCQPGRLEPPRHGRQGAARRRGVVGRKPRHARWRGCGEVLRQRVGGAGAAPAGRPVAADSRAQRRPWRLAAAARGSRAAAMHSCCGGLLASALQAAGGQRRCAASWLGWVHCCFCGFYCCCVADAARYWRRQRPGLQAARTPRSAAGRPRPQGAPARAQASREGPDERGAQGLWDAT